MLGLDLATLRSLASGRVVSPYARMIRGRRRSKEAEMGVTYIDGEVRGSNGTKETVHFLVDSGAVYSLLPMTTWQALGLKPKRKAIFRLADGTPVEREISECHITLPQGDGHTPVILGLEGDEALLGVVTLEILGLVLNPFNRTLQPMRMLLA
jgi:predicted aspartyl protease